MLRGDKNIHVQAQAIDELKPQLAMLHRIDRGHAQLLLRLADRALHGGFAWINLAAGAVDLARAESALFADQKHPPTRLVDDEHQGREHAGLPLGPVDRHAAQGITVKR